MSQLNWKEFNRIYWMLICFLILLFAYFLLADGASEGPLEIFGIEGFKEQFLANAFGLLLLAMLINRLGKDGFLESIVYYSGSREYLFYLLQTIVLPVVLVWPFAWGYFRIFGGEWNWNLYINSVFPVVITFIIVVNMAMLLRELWIFAAQQQRPKVTYTVIRQSIYRIYPSDVKPQAAATDRKHKEADTNPILIPQFARNTQMLQVSCRRRHLHIPVGSIVYACVEERAVRVHLADGRVCRYAYSMQRLIQEIGNDPRFFATSRWIINGSYIERVDDTFSRIKHIHLRFPFKDYFALPKEKVSAFRAWQRNFAKLTAEC